MTNDQCITKLRAIVEATDPRDGIAALQLFAAATSLVNWVCKDDEAARSQFGVFISYYELYALRPDNDEEGMTKDACLGELVKLPLHLPRT